jgi:hypothetical protein
MAGKLFLKKDNIGTVIYVPSVPPFPVIDVKI